MADASVFETVEYRFDELDLIELAQLDGFQVMYRDVSRDPEIWVMRRRRRAVAAERASLSEKWRL